MFVLDVVIQIVVVGVEENPGKMNVTLVVLVITNQTRTENNGEDHQIVSEMVDLELAEEAVLAGKISYILFSISIFYTISVNQRLRQIFGYIKSAKPMSFIFVEMLFSFFDEIEYVFC